MNYSPLDYTMSLSLRAYVGEAAREARAKSARHAEKAGQQAPILTPEPLGHMPQPRGHLQKHSEAVSAQTDCELIRALIVTGVGAYFSIQRTGLRTIKWIITLCRRNCSTLPQQVISNCQQLEQLL